jgi:hypothetical protein
LHDVLSRCAILACTRGTGLLPLCDMAAATWRAIDNRDGPLSALALASIRAMTNTMITIILADIDGSRWCEIAFAPASSAETFLELYPDAKFLCLHRNCQDVIYAAIQANPWGLADSPFGPFAAAYPGNSVAAIAAYWAANTEPLLAFEQAHPQACRRIRYEDLADNPEQAAQEIFAYLELAQDDPVTPCWMANDTQPTADARGSDLQIPSHQIPSAIMAQVNALLTRIGYRSPQAPRQRLRPARVLTIT